MDKQYIEKLVKEAILNQLNAQNTNENKNISRSFEIPSSAKAAVLVEKNKFEIQEFPLRQINDDEILVKVESCGICGTDVHCYKNDPFSLIPVVLGHEGTGQVVALGNKVKKDSVGKPINIGDKIVTSVLDSEDPCQIAKYDPLKANLCDLSIYGLYPNTPDDRFNGYFGQYIIIKPHSSVFVVNNMSLDLRLLIEPAAVAVHALERAKKSNMLNFRSRVIIQGAGPIGLMMIAAVRAFGVNNIIAIDGNDSRLATARQMGADYTINFKEYKDINELSSKVKSLTKSIGAHFGFQVTGVPAAASNLFKLIARGGGICEVGFFVDNGQMTINPHWDICQKEISLFGSWAYTKYDYPNAYHFLQRAKSIGIPIENLVTHHFSLSQIDEAFKTSISQAGIKVAIDLQ